ncbi:MAG TPA: hypothetical protein GX734_01475 [Clostridiaceae bacterium]|jgi:hypothetical protein|nr:hypothetical protein [Clostridiaceae bacterium]
MKESIPTWILEKPLPSLPDREEVARIAKSARRQFRYAVTDDDLLVVLRDIDDLLWMLEEGEEELRIRSFYRPHDQVLNDLYFEYGNAKLLMYSELADLLTTISRSSKGKRLDAFVSSTYLLDADRIASTSSKSIVAHLVLERELVASQMKRLRDVSLSTEHVALVGGEVRLHFQSASRDRRARAYNSLISQLNKNKAEMVGQFLELHMLRRMIGEKAGYKNFYEYATRRAGLTDTFRSNIHLFRLLIQEYVSPLISHVLELQWRRLAIEEPEPWDLMFPADFGVPVMSREAFPLEKTFVDACRYVCEAQTPVFETMLDRGTLRISVLPCSDDDGDTSYYPSHSSGTRWLRSHDLKNNESYLLMEAVPQEIAVNLLFYETGCLLFEQSQPSKGVFTLPNNNMSLSEMIAGHSMAFLSQRAWGTFYGPMTLYAREYTLTDLLMRLPLACALDEMEEFLAKARISDLNVFQHAWREIASRYRIPGTSKMSPGIFPLDDAWLYAPAIWSTPLLGINDAIALVTVLGILPLGKQHQDLEHSMLRLLNIREGIEPTVRASEAGYPSPFDEETVRKAVFAIADFLAL